MSKRNYTNYSKKNENLEAEAVETPEVQVWQMTASETEPETETTTTTTAVESVPEIPKIGVVANCARLNVRSKPATGAEVVCVIDADIEVEIDEAKSTADWYKVITNTNVEGYCMRKFIVVQ